MSVGTANGSAADNAVVPGLPAVIPKGERECEYIPLGEATAIKLSVNLIKQYLVKPTARNRMPSDQDVMVFMMLCKTRALNPWVGDAYCVGYDSGESATFNLITSVQALFKRADAHPEYDGMESGIIVLREDGSYEDRSGDWFAEDEILVGGWAKVFRKDRTRAFEERIRFVTFNKDRSVWKSDPEGMISKCAEAGALRKAFPTQLGGLYTREEMERTRTIDATATAVSKPAVESAMDNLTSELQGKRKAITSVADPVVDAQAQLEAARSVRDSEATEAAVVQDRVETKLEVAASEKVVQKDEGVVADFRKQISACESEEAVKVITMSIRRSKAIGDDEKRFLTRLAGERASAINGME